MSNLLGDNWSPAVFGPFLCKGVTFASFQVFGIFLVSIDFWNILVSGSAMFLAVSFRNLDAFDQVPMTLFLSTFLDVLVLFEYRILLFQDFDQFLVEILECPE